MNTPQNTTSSTSSSRGVGPAGLSAAPGRSVQMPRTREALLAMVFAFPVALFALFGMALPPSPASCQSSPVSRATRTPVVAAIAAVLQEVRR